MGKEKTLVQLQVYKVRLFRSTKIYKLTYIKKKIPIVRLFIL